MRISKLIFIALFAFLAVSVYAKAPDRPGNKGSKKATPRAECANSEAQIDQEINNVRARLLAGGDCWWDLSDGSYIVPKVEPGSGQRPVSSIYAGSVWLGGVDLAGNLKLACQDYRSDGKNDFWNGPLNDLGTTDEAKCKDWDRHFRVTGAEIREHLKNWRSGNVNPDLIPIGLKGWPAQGSPYFADVWGFDLPNTAAGLAGFYDQDANGLYDPLKGDYPSIDIAGCKTDRYPDEMIFWIYNDQGAGATHRRTDGKAIQMEIQVQAFGYTTNDELNDMTFQRYKLINRATEPIDSMFFAMWADADLGCSEDDFVGCDTAKSLMYIYNQDNQDGSTGCSCGDVATYCEKVPILGIDYFRGPNRETILPNGDIKIDTLGMSSFTYYNRGGLGPWPTGMQDPSSPTEYYNYITGTWRDGIPFTYGGSGYNPTDPAAVPIKYAFTEEPNNPTGWSMQTANLSIGDRRTIQATGPFRLNPTAKNELIIGVPWVADQDYPAPSMDNLFRADQLAQGLFDNCFELLDGPTAPTVEWVELNKQFVAVLTNDSSSNNFAEKYNQPDFLAPESISDEAKLYNFEGYLIYQLVNPNVSASDYKNPDVSRLVYQVDTKNNVSTLFNWELTPSPTGKPFFAPYPRVDGENGGIRHTFTIESDLFAKGTDKSLINHKKYYYSVIAYAHNEYEKFDFTNFPPKGQQRPFLAGRLGIEIFTVIPRPIIDQELNAVYGEGPEITRNSGVGAGHNFLDMNEATRNAVIDGTFDGNITYQGGKGPLDVQIFNPFEVKDGEFELRIVDGNMNDNKIDYDATWQLKRLPDGEIIASERTIAGLNEQLVKKYGFSVSVAQTGDSGNRDRDSTEMTLLGADKNGGLGSEVEYADPNNQWLTGIPDEDQGFFNFVKNSKLEADEELDRHKGLGRNGNGWFVPYALCDWRAISNTSNPPNLAYISPAWTEKTTNTQGVLNGAALGNSVERTKKLKTLPNIDIVFTQDKSKWSRCVVAEGASYLFTGVNIPDVPPVDPAFKTESPAAPGKSRLMFDTRYALSVGKDDSDNDGKPDPDGAKDAAGNDVRGMGWFPGYAIDVETGRRLNIFFSENSCYDSAINPSFTGRDMLFNPTDNLFVDNFVNSPDDVELGGYHFVYVMNTEYDECAELYRKFSPELNTNGGQAKVSQVSKIAWAGMVKMADGYRMKSLKDGLIPNDLRVKVRVDNPYQTWFKFGETTNQTQHPVYTFKISGREAQPLDQVQALNALDSVKVSPNPYYGYSQYETSAFTNIVKITNLPAKCTVSIYSIDGKFIKKYDRNETYVGYKQIAPDVEWDMKNARGISVSSGVYLVHINAPGIGEKTIKWFGIARQFDPSGL
jgi:hypothetical protein